jgi:hypothetical protein
MGKRSLAVAMLVLLSLAAFAFPLSAKGTRRQISTAKASTNPKSVSKSKSTSTKKPVHVTEYKRKDGTVVSAHARSLPGSKAAPVPRSTPSTKSKTMPSSPHASTVAARNANGKIARSQVAKSQFLKQSGYPKGRPGYVVDHIVPLECGGADSPSNMQWQTVAQAKIKDRTERNCRR